MKLSTRMSLSFATLCIFSIFLVGFLAFQHSRRTIEQETINQLLSANMLKEDELNRWLLGLEQRLRSMASRPLIIDFSATLAVTQPDDSKFRIIRNRIIEDHFLDSLQEIEGFFELMILRKDDAMILVASDESLEGKYGEQQAYYTEGKKQTFIQNLHYSETLQKPALAIGTPIKDKKGRLVAVLVGWVDNSVLSSIIGKNYFLNQTEDAYLVNAFNLFVTEPRFGEGYALKKSIHTKGVVESLTHQDVKGLYTNYHNVPVIGVYRWLPKREMCLVNEITQAEAFRPIHDLKNSIATVGMITALLAALTGWIIARTIALPLRHLVKVSENMGPDNMEYQFTDGGNDELGDLSRSFYRMTERLKETLVSRDLLVQEVKERKQAEDCLRESTNRLALVMDSIDSMIYVVDLKTYEILFINKHGRKILGDVTGKTCWKTLNEGYNGPCSYCTNDKLLNADGTPSGIYVWEFKNKKNKRWFDCRDQAIMWEEGRMARLGIATDITDRKRQEEELIKTHNLLQETQEIARLGGWEYNIEANHMTWTIEVYRIYGVDPADFDPNDISRNMRFYLPEDRLLIEEAFEKAVNSGEPYDLQLRLVRADGQLIWVRTTGKPFLENEKVARVTGNIMDITEQKQAESKQRELEYQIQQAHKRESLFTMAGAIAHNFNNLFTVILGNLEMAKELMPSHFPGMKELLEAEKSVRRAAELSLLMLTYVGCRPLPKEPIDMARLLRNLLLEIGSEIPGNVRLESNISTGESLVIMDPFEARKVITSLITNALEALGKMNGTVQIKLCLVQDDKLFTGVNHTGIPLGSGLWVCLEVTDNGEGMDIETQAKMFDPFFTTKFLGRGLGLAITLGIVRASEGAIFVDSELHKGTTVRLLIPAA